MSRKRKKQGRKVGRWIGGGIVALVVLSALSSSNEDGGGAKQERIIPTARATVQVDSVQSTSAAPVRNTAINTQAPAITNTNAPAPTEAGDRIVMTVQARPEAFYSTGNINVRDCAETSCGIATTLSTNQRVDVLGTVNGQEVNAGNDVWYVIEWDGEAAYIYSTLLTSQETVVNSGSSGGGVNSSSPAAGSTSFVCPRNCADAVAMGLSAQQAATCSNLDRDNDGVACYGD